jgi:hypothetical protein
MEMENIEELEYEYDRWISEVDNYNVYISDLIDNSEYVNNITAYIMNNITFQQNTQNTIPYVKLSQNNFILLLKLNSYYKASTCIDCSICFDKIKKNEYSRMLNCNHRFHKKCIDKWLYIAYTNGNQINCPICRQIVQFK